MAQYAGMMYEVYDGMSLSIGMPELEVALREPRLDWPGFVLIVPIRIACFEAPIVWVGSKGT